MTESKRIPGRYVVLFLILFAILCAAFATWGISAMRKLPKPPEPKMRGPFG